MRKILTPGFLLITAALYSQTPILSVGKTYFRMHPFESRFSSFIQSLQKDPYFTVNDYKRRTDSTFFFLEGTYKIFNPFKYTPTELRMIIAEEEIIHDDSLHTLDTIINLQLLAVADSTEASLKAVEKEFKRFHNNQAGHFSNFTTNSYDNKNGKTIGGVNNYFVFPFSVAPVTTAWGLLPGSNRYTFTITVRFKVKYNEAQFIENPGEL